MKRLAILSCVGAAIAMTAANAPAKDEPSPVSAAGVHALADDAARSWAEDARLLYVENDADVSLGGHAKSWGYLYWSDHRDAGRSYSLHEDRIVLANNPSVDLPSLPLHDNWIDSDAALDQAEASGGRDYRENRAGRVQNMVLVRGVFDEEHPERSTWTVVYSSPSYPSLWIVIDATSGDLVRKWEG
jgi:hypothetical protein